MNKSIRLICRGRLMRDTDTLIYYYHKQPIIHLHCALSDILPSSNTTLAHNKAKHNKKHLAGFDILSESGYNEEEIRNIRLQFHDMRGTVGYIDGETPSEENIRLEEDWMEVTGSLLPDGSIQGSSFKEILSGLILGICLGLLCLFWVRESVFTRTHQLGIVLGISIHTYYSIIHLFY
ncbi:hypothetical protein BDB01DRAFT_131365 [Pilobolus umbonatus]|nr:hypothetical protein BDB01DRAFT_131365 [Pilobolus umbonatus]